jgi:hypothetical protein
LALAVAPAAFPFTAHPIIRPLPPRTGRFSSSGDFFMPPFTPFRSTLSVASTGLAALILSASAHAAGPTGLLNDTGQTLCNNGTAMVACNVTSTGDAAANPRQDGRFGRDVAAPTKVGGGVAGFDFTKVCQDGTLGCTAPANVTATPAAADWACTKDNVTNLIWSLHSGYGEWTTYARTTLPTAHNTAARCGYSTGWRLPTRRELLSIVNLDGSNPAVDAVYFPSTQANNYWTNDPYQRIPAFAWYVYFYYGYANYGDTTVWQYVRLVRSGQ